MSRFESPAVANTEQEEKSDGADIIEMEEVLKEAGVNIEKETGAEERETSDSDKPEQPEDKEEPAQTPEEAQALETAREDRIQELRTGLRERMAESPDSQEDTQKETGSSGGISLTQTFNMGGGGGGGSSAEKPKGAEVKKKKKGLFWRLLGYLFRF